MKRNVQSLIEMLVFVTALHAVLFGLPAEAQTSAKPTSFGKIQPATVCSSTQGGPACAGGIGAQCVNTSWTASTTPNVTYNLYRGTSSGGEGTTPIATGIPGTTYQDNAIPAGAANLYYLAAAVTAGGQKSVPSNEACAQVPTPTNPPANLQAVPNSN